SFVLAADQNFSIEGRVLENDENATTAVSTYVDFGGPNFNDTSPGQNGGFFGTDLLKQFMEHQTIQGLTFEFTADITHRDSLDGGKIEGNVKVQYTIL